MSDVSLRRVDLAWDGNVLTFTNYEDPTAPTASYLTKLTGWYGGVGTEGTDPQRAIHHGQIPTQSKRTGRTLTLGAEMYFASERDRDIADRFVSGILQDGWYGDLTYTINGVSTTAQVKLDGEVKHATTGYDFIVLEVPLTAPWPYLLGPEQNTAMSTPNSTIGLRWDQGLFYGGVMDWGEFLPTPLISNNGNAPAWMKFRVSGEMDFGFAIDIEGNTIRYPHHVNPGKDVIIDTRTGRVTVDKRDVTHMLSEWEWTPIPPYSTIAPTFTPTSQHAQGFCEVTWNDTYI